MNENRRERQRKIEDRYRGEAILVGLILFGSVIAATLVSAIEVFEWLIK